MQHQIIFFSESDAQLVIVQVTYEHMREKNKQFSENYLLVQILFYKRLPYRHY